MKQENLRVFIKACCTDDSNIVNIGVRDEIKMYHEVEEYGRERKREECNLYIL